MGLGYRVWARLGLGRAVAPGGSVEPVLVYNGRVYQLSPWGYRDTREVMLEYGPGEIEALASGVSRSDRGIPLGGVRLLAPVEKPSKVLAVGLNYRAHAAETGRTPPKTPDVFAKTPNSVIGPGDPIVLHEEGLRVDAEAELALVIGVPARSLEPVEAREAIWGYMCFNDVSARSDQFAEGVSQWWKGKSRDAYAPTGPIIVPRSLVDPGHGLRLTQRLTGRLLQDGTTSDMIHSPEAIVAHVSRGVLLEPGDIIATGTPPGVGYARKPPVHLRPGDTVEVCVESIGCIENPVVADTQGWAREA